MTLMIFYGCEGSEQDTTFDDATKAYKSDDFQSAITLYTKACDSGNGESCFWLGSLYESGNSVKQDIKKAVTLYKQACGLGGSHNGCEDYNRLNK